MKRSAIDIYADLLRLSRKSSRITRLQYRGNLSWSALNSKLEELISMGLLERNSPVFVTTEKGRKFLQAYDHLKSLMKNNPFFAR